MVRNLIDEIIKKKMIKLIKKKKKNSLQSLGTKIIFYLNNYHTQRSDLRRVMDNTCIIDEKNYVSLNDVLR